MTAQEAFDGVRKVFGDWARQEVPAETFIDPPAPTRRLIVVNKPDAVQTEVVSAIARWKSTSHISTARIRVASGTTFSNRP